MCKLLVTFIVMSSLSLRAETAAQGQAHTGESTSEKTREEKRFSEYETLYNKFSTWAGKLKEESHAWKADGANIKVKLSKQELEKASAHLKRIKWYREKLVACETNDKSSKLLGEHLDACLVPGLLAEGSKESKLENQYEFTLALEKLYTCKEDASTYFEGKKKIINDRSKYAVDWEMQIKLNELFDLFIGKAKRPEIKEHAVAMIDEQKKVNPANFCVVEQKSQVADTNSPATSPQPSPSASLKEQVKPQGAVSQQEGYAKPKAGYSTGSYNAGYGAGGCGYGAAYGAGGCGGKGAYNYNPTDYKFDPNLYKFDPNRYAFNPDNYEGGGDYIPPMYIPPNYDDGPNYAPRPNTPYFPPPPVDNGGPIPVANPVPYQAPVAAPLPYLPPITPVTPYVPAGGFGFSLGISGGGSSSYRPPYIVQGGSGMGSCMPLMGQCQSMCSPNLMGMPCPKGFGGMGGIPGMPGMGQFPGMYPGRPTTLPGISNVNQRPPFYPPTMGGYPTPGMPAMPGFPSVNPYIQNYPMNNFPGGSIPTVNYPGVNGNNTISPRPPVYAPNTTTNNVGNTRYRVPRAIAKGQR